MNMKKKLANYLLFSVMAVRAGDYTGGEVSEAMHEFEAHGAFVGLQERLKESRILNDYLSREADVQSEEFQQNLKLLTSDLNKVKTESRSVLAENENLKRIIKENEELIRQLRLDSAGLKSSVSRDTDSESLEETIEIREKLLELKRLLQSEEQQKKETIEELRLLQEEFAKKIAEFEKTVKTLTSEIETKREECERLKKDVHDISSAGSAFEMEPSSSKDESRSLEDELSETQITDQKEVILTLEHRVKEKDDLIQSLKLKNATAEENLKKMKDRFDALTKEHEESKRKMKFLQDENAKLVYDLRFFRDTEDDEMRLLVDQVEIYKIEIKKLEDKVLKYQLEIERKGAEIEKQREELNIARIRMMLLEYSSDFSLNPLMQSQGSHDIQLYFHRLKELKEKLKKLCTQKGRQHHSIGGLMLGCDFSRDTAYRKAYLEVMIQQITSAIQKIEEGDETDQKIVVFGSIFVDTV